MDGLLQEYQGFTTPEVEVVMEPLQLSVDIHQAIRMIQKNDRGRQGIWRVNMVIKQLKNLMMKEELGRKFKEGKIQRESEENKENNACVYVQRRIRGIIARKHVEKVRADEMEFLGMQMKKKTKEELKNDPIKKMEQTRIERKLIQANNM